MAEKLPSLFFVEHYIEIPKKFQCTVTEMPFSHCTICQGELIQSNTSYIIEKAIKNFPDRNSMDTIFEYAMCINCMEEMRKSLSGESRQKVDNYLLEHSNLDERRNKLLSKEKIDVDDWISYCIINNESTKNLQEYQIMCQCQGKYMLFTHMPFMISCTATEEMQQLLSKQTKDELDRFYDTHLGIPPEYKEFFKTKTPIL